MKITPQGRLRLAALVLAPCLLLAAACGLNRDQASGIYLGTLRDAGDQTRELLLQLHRDGSFNLREIRYGSPTATRTSQGTWTVDQDLIVLSVEGEKDERYRWLPGRIRNEAAILAHPELGTDHLELLRIAQ